jgi:hypothetical protein
MQWFGNVTALKRDASDMKFGVTCGLGRLNYIPAATSSQRNGVVARGSGASISQSLCPHAKC